MTARQSPARPSPSVQGAVEAGRGLVAAPGPQRLDFVGLTTVNKEALPQPPDVIASSIIAKVVIPGAPMSKQRPRFVRKTGTVFTPRETRDREHTIGQYVWAHGWRRPPDAEMAFGVRAVFYVADQQRKDTDNMLKLVLDGLNKVVWADDCQVFELMGWKAEDAENPRTELVVYSLGFSAKRMATCARCSKRYRSYPSWKNRQFCSAKCRNLAAMTGKHATCANCHAYVYRPEHTVISNRSGQYFCSKACLTAVKTTAMVCAQCGLAFSRPTSLLRGRTVACCSRPCANLWRVGRPRLLEAVDP